MDLGNLITGFPLSGPQDGRLDFARGEDALRESIWNILMTRPGERLMRPEFGAGLGQFIHQPNTETTRALIVDAVRVAISRWEPRVVLLGVTATASPQDRTQVALAIEYRPVAANQPDRLEVSLSLEGTV